MNGRDALLAAFDELFDAAVERLNGTVTPDERAGAREQFTRRFANALDLTRGIQLHEMPRDAVDAMKSAIGGLSTAELAGVIATVPLAQQAQDMMRAIAKEQAQQRMLEHVALQADTRYGGN